MTKKCEGLSSTAIKYLLTIYELCGADRGARCVDVASRMKVSIPSAHAMIRHLCDLGLTEKERYGIVYLSEEGRAQAKLYEKCCRPFCEKLMEKFSLDEEICLNTACLLLSQIPDELEAFAAKVQ